MPHRMMSLLNVAVVVSLALLCGALQSCKRVGKQPLNVILIAVDTLRADHLGCYGWSEPTTPNIDDIASRGTLFEKMICQVPQTLPSFCTILTGTYPRKHGVRANGIFTLPDDALTMAEVFEQNHYRTAAFIAGFPLDGRFGLKQGFEDYFDEMKSDRPMQGVPQQGGLFLWDGHVTSNFENTADVVTDEALKWLGTKGDQPFFIMVHYFDPHQDYDPPARFLHRFAHPYSGEVAFADEQIGRLLRRIDALGIAQNTLVAFTADHGECLGEYGRYFHQEQLCDAAIHVPFILRLPGRIPAGTRVTGSCRSVDIMPTVLELAGIPRPGTILGRSLVPAVQKGITENDPCYFSTLYGKLELNLGFSRRGIADHGWKLIRDKQVHPQTGVLKEAYELYDLEHDPEELTNLAKSKPPQLAALQATLDKLLADHPETKLSRMVPDEEAIKRLKSLGYLQ